MNFSSNLRYLRKQKGMSQEDLANKLGYKSFTTIQKWESGVSEPSVSTVKKIAGIFGVTMDQMINEDSSGFVPLQLTEQEEHLVVSFRSLNEDGRDRAISYVDDLSGMDKYRLSDLEAQMWEDADEIVKDEYEEVARLTKHVK